MRKTTDHQGRRERQNWARRCRLAAVVLALGVNLWTGGSLLAQNDTAVDGLPTRSLPPSRVHRIPPALKDEEHAAGQASARLPFSPKAGRPHPA